MNPSRRAPRVIRIVVDSARRDVVYAALEVNGVICSDDRGASRLEYPLPAGVEDVYAIACA